jgi:N,N'-diacetylchitobiose transport system permease protein
MTTVELRKPPRRRTMVEGGRRKSRVGTAIANTVGLIIIVVMAFPAYWMVNTAFKPPNEVLTFTPHFLPDSPTFANFTSALKAPLFLDGLVNGLIVTTCATLSALVVGFLGALAVARFRFYGRRALIFVVLLVQMVPFIALLIPLFLMLNSLQLTNTLPGVTIVYVVLVLPYTVWTLRGFISNVPKELDEAALVDGCSRWQTFTKVILPLTGPGWWRPRSSASSRRGTSSSSSTRSTPLRTRTSCRGCSTTRPSGRRSGVRSWRAPSSPRSRS